jgi:serine/threonine protein kinase
MSDILWYCADPKSWPSETKVQLQYHFRDGICQAIGTICDVAGPQIEKVRPDERTQTLMNETLARRASDTGSQIDFDWQRRLDALVCGECSEDDFMEEISTLREAAPDAAWNIVALIDQRYRRGQIPVDLFRSIESRVAQRELASVDCGTTVELHPAIGSSVVITQRFGSIDRTRIPSASESDNHVQATALALQTAPSTTSSVRLDDQSSPVVLEIGRVLRSRYVIESRLGSGGMGTVFKAMDRYRCDLPEGNRHVAIKILHKKIGGDQEILANLRREFYSAQTLSHRNIVKVYELDRDGDAAFFTMELLEGELLSALIEQMHPVPISRSYAWALIRDVGAGLEHAHSRNVVHADIKPQNIMITHSGEVRILDFGASSAPTRRRSLADLPEKNNIPALTPAYACCELLDGQRAEPRDDLYALACLSYELLAGEHPFQRRRSTEARDLGLMPRRPPGLSRRQWRTIIMGLSWSREGRSISVRDWLAKLGLAPAAAGRLLRPYDLKTLRPRRRTMPSFRVVALLAVLLIGLIVCVSLIRTSFDGKASNKDIVPKTPVSAPIRTGPELPISMPGGSPAQQSPVEPRMQNSLLAADEPIPAPRPLPEASRITTHDATRPTMQTEKLDNISISADTYRIRSGENFAEIHVRHSSESDGDTSFTWWTEDSSAMFGVDYIPQGRTTQIISKGRRLATLFIKIVPNASRKRPAVFYVAIGDPSDGSSLGSVARTAILLPPVRP